MITMPRERKLAIYEDEIFYLKSAIFSKIVSNRVEIEKAKYNWDKKIDEKILNEENNSLERIYHRILEMEFYLKRRKDKNNEGEI